MHRIDSEGTAAALPTPASVGATVGFFTKGNPLTAVEATIVSDDWCNSIQEELAYVIEQAGGTLDKTIHTQLRAAIEAMVSGVSGGVLSKTFSDTPFTASAASKIIKWTTTGGNCVQNLPVASTVPGAIFTIVKITNDANTVTITPNGSEKINGDSTLVLDTQWDSARVMSISTGWLLIG